ncbi:MAG: hypothetical protein PVF40_04610 [Ectothiorhodospiraceae bacterium]
MTGSMWARARWVVSVAAVAMSAQAAAATAAPASLDLAAVAADPLSGGADGTVVSGDTRQSLDLTLYQGGFALVREVRELALLSGMNRFIVSGLPRTFQADSLLLQLEGNARIRDERMDDRGLARERLLQLYRGREVVLAPRPGADWAQRRGRLEDVVDGTPVVRVDGRLEYASEGAPWRIVFPDPPEGLLPGPAVGVDAVAEDSGTRRLTLTYLTGGLGWKAAYELDMQGDVAALVGKATLHNGTDVGFRQARVALVAGDVARESDARPAPQRMEMAAAKAADGLPRGEAGPWHLYHLPTPVTLPAGQSLGVRLLDAGDLKVTKRFRVTGVGALQRPLQQPQTPPVTVQLEVQRPADGGQPLPGGVVRVLDRSGDAPPRFLGEDRIDHTPVGEPLELTLGRAFDVVAERHQEAFQRLSDRRYEVAWRIQLRNRGDSTASVQVNEQLGGGFELVKSDPEPADTSASGATWRIDLPAQSATEIRYRARIGR